MFLARLENGNLGQNLSLTIDKKTNQKYIWEHVLLSVPTQLNPLINLLWQVNMQHVRMNLKVTNPLHQFSVEYLMTIWKCWECCFYSYILLQCGEITQISFVRVSEGRQTDITNMQTMRCNCLRGAVGAVFTVFRCFEQ